MRKRSLRLVFLLATLASVSCSVATTVGRNTEAIEKSSATIQSNASAIQESTRGTTALVPALQQVQKLEGPLTQVAGLDPTLRSVADLRGPMTNVAGLGPAMESLAKLDQPMTRLVG